MRLQHLAYDAEILYVNVDIQKSEKHQGRNTDFHRHPLSDGGDLWILCWGHEFDCYVKGNLKIASWCHSHVLCKSTMGLVGFVLVCNVAML